jgi:arylsulfatase A-like enzyme
MSDTEQEKRGVTRRDVMVGAGAGALVLGLGLRAARADDDEPARQTGYNILFLLTDQERYMSSSQLPAGLKFTGRERLQRRGVTFTNHHINSSVCTSSRSVIYTGQHIQHTKLFDNMDVPWTKDMGKDVPTLGALLTEAGYYAAYKGKWHLSKELGTHDELALPQEKLTAHIADYGFNDYVGIGDVIGMTQGGYLNDDIIAAQAVRWLRVRGQSMQKAGEPWMLAVNLVNPHDVMFYNTDAPGQAVQDDGSLLIKIDRAPDVPLYRRQWDVPLPKSRHESFDAEGRPAAHKDYQLARGAMVGNFPDEDARWRGLLNYYFNCIRQTDQLVGGILDELDALGLTKNTIVVMTADHGELGGAHGTHGKGTTAYREQIHVPLIVSHPGYPKTHGQQCGAVTSHLDLVPSLIGWSGADAKKKADITSHLHGKSLTPLLEKGAQAGLNDLRVGSLYCFNMFLYLDSDYVRKIQAFLNAGNDPKTIGQQGFKPDFKKRGAIRSVFDGRYKYNRYFSPKEHNQPRTLEGIFKLNDVELFDLKVDPDEMQNLALDPEKYGDLLLAMNEKMNALIQEEVGKRDDGSFLPGEDANWAATRFDP